MRSNQVKNKTTPTLAAVGSAKYALGWVWLGSLLSLGCGPQGMSLQGQTFVATSSVAVQTGYYGGNYGTFQYGSGFSGYGSFGSANGWMTNGDRLRFVDASRVEYQASASGTSISGTYYQTNANLTSIGIRLDSQSMEFRLQLQNGGQRLIHQQTGQILIRQ